MKINGEKIKLSEVFTKGFVMKCVILLFMICLFMTIGYVLALERSITIADNYVRKVVIDVCGLNFYIENEKALSSRNEDIIAMFIYNSSGYFLNNQSINFSEKTKNG